MTHSRKMCPPLPTHSKTAAIAPLTLANGTLMAQTIGAQTIALHSSLLLLSVEVDLIAGSAMKTTMPNTIVMSTDTILLAQKLNGINSPLTKPTRSQIFSSIMFSNKQPKTPSLPSFPYNHPIHLMSRHPNTRTATTQTTYNFAPMCHL